MKVAVGLSGGVDSSTAAAILCDRGLAVTGVTLWLMKGKGQCCSEGMVDAAAICEQLEIEHHVVDSRELFQAEIVDYLVQGYGQGITPLPCSQCNKAVKFGPMLRYARERLGIDRIATGHYAQVRHNPETDRYELWRAVDRQKDQTYFLYDLDQEILAAVDFPLGEHTKDETRAIAAQFHLSTAEKPESQDLCLIESYGSMHGFLEQYLTPQAGDIVTEEGTVLGKHQGVHRYTIGQRKGLGIAYPEPLYVLRLDPGRNQVVVGPRSSAHWGGCTVQRVNWVSMAEPTEPFRAQVQVRYRSAPDWATLTPLDDRRVSIAFDDPQFSITPGQAAVWYDGDRLLGGGVIEAAIRQPSHAPLDRDQLDRDQLDRDQCLI
ncbi:MAG: tRNA 2-thiouridine(34) synthase MnmA [Prochlorothrix sp.]|nr:tRNA 2-thiouridine(34) synthase MnmA [Prochlorothrix sp.]